MKIVPQPPESAHRQNQTQSTSEPVAVVVHSVERNHQSELLRPQEVRTVEVPWYEEQVWTCVPSSDDREIALSFVLSLLLSVSLLV